MLLQHKDLLNQLQFDHQIFWSRWMSIFFTKVLRKDADIQYVLFFDIRGRTQLREEIYENRVIRYTNGIKPVIIGDS
jgi:hypothetical protein